MSGLAGRYAMAVFGLAREGRLLDAVAQDLARIEALFDDSADLRRLVRSPMLTRTEQGRAIAALLERMDAHPLTRRLLGVLAENRRLFALPLVIRAFRAGLAEYRGEVAADVTSARPLAEGQVSTLRQTLARSVGREVTLSTRVDPDLLGGLVVRLGSRMLDSSLRTQLANLKVAMKGVR